MCRRSRSILYGRLLRRCNRIYGELRLRRYRCRILYLVFKCRRCSLSGRYERRCQHAQNNDYYGKSPCSLLQYVCSLPYAECLVACRKIGCKSASLRILDKYYQCKKYTRNNNDNSDSCIHISSSFLILFRQQGLQSKHFFPDIAKLVSHIPHLPCHTAPDRHKSWQESLYNTLRP